MDRVVAEELPEGEQQLPLKAQVGSQLKLASEPLLRGMSARVKPLAPDLL